MSVLLSRECFVDGNFVYDALSLLLLLAALLPPSSPNLHRSVADRRTVDGGGRGEGEGGGEVEGGGGGGVGGGAVVGGGEGGGVTADGGGEEVGGEAGLREVREVGELRVVLVRRRLPGLMVLPPEPSLLTTHPPYPVSGRSSTRKGPRDPRERGGGKDQRQGEHQEEEQERGPVVAVPRPLPRPFSGQ